MEEASMQIIGHVHTDFPTKFGLPRQSGLVEELVGRIELEPEFRRAEAFVALRNFPIFGFSGSFLSVKKSIGRQRSNRLAWAGKSVWESLLRAHPFAPIPLGCPALSY